MDKKLVFISSPYRGDTQKNIENARAFCKYAILKGHIPIAPHLLFPQFLNDRIEADRELGMAACLEILERCDEIWVCGDEVTDGMRAEIARAIKLELPMARVYAEDRK